MTFNEIPYIDRELSWLAFNQRVLAEAQDERVPLLERLKFLAITGSNLDEFTMVRVGGLRLLGEPGGTGPDASDEPVDARLEAIVHSMRLQVEAQYDCYLEDIEPGLAAHGIRRLGPGDLTDDQAAGVESRFDEELSSVLTPIAIESARRFPLLLGLNMNLLVRRGPAPGSKARQRFAVIPFGRVVSRIVTLPTDEGYAYMLLEDALTACIARFFPDEPVRECVPFRITRNADIAIREDSSPDLLSGMEAVLDARRESSCIRLEIAADASAASRKFLVSALGVREEQLLSIPGPLDLSAMMRLANIRGHDHLKYKPWAPRKSVMVDPRKSMFDVIARSNVLLHHPYEQFDPVLRLIEEAAQDPEVLAIKQILYRTSEGSKIVDALRRAAENGKQVTALVELKARFDEARNIEWARSLEHAGVQVIYGVKGLKTHAKLCIIVRAEPHGIRRYVHFGTGNYNEVTARLYCDVSYLTNDEDLAADAVSFFNAITGSSQPQKYRKVAAAPHGLRDQVLTLIAAETERRRRGRKAHILAQMNSLVDRQIIDALYEASNAGVRVDLNVRGICCLRPGVPDLSEHVTVSSVVDRYLEHARIFYFHNGGDEKLFISSADWMPRNLDRRVELLVPVEDDRSRSRLVHVLRRYTRDNVKGWALRPDGRYERKTSPGGRKKLRSQEALYDEACEAEDQLDPARGSMFEPYRAAEGAQRA